ncbi:MAG: hypothetical protein LUE64_03365 [Candidatus Gastranaerophilales bacterium]|nr:hypothetical protein [Candidatus Gastranaerophilales bacterium]
MSNPFAIGSSYTDPSVIGGGSTYGAYGAYGTSGTGTTQPKTTSAGEDINEVSMIGASKRAGFENGLGGTNNPDDHKIFYAA